MLRFTAILALACCTSGSNGGSASGITPDAPHAPSALPEPTATAAASSPAPNVLTMFVDARTVDCEGEGPRTCLRVRPSESEEWVLFYDRIEGFEHEEGNVYQLKVEVSGAANPPADASARRYRLVEIVSKKPEAR